MERFPHLNFVQKVVGKPRLRGGGKPRPETIRNKENRPGHYGYLTGRTNELMWRWQQEISERPDLPPLDEKIIPFFLQINPDIITNDFDLKNFGIEIISQENDGYIIGASLDGFASLNDKIEKFLNNQRGGGVIADLWQIIDGKQWKPEHILSDYLLSIWNEIDDAEIFEVEVGIAFDKPLTVPDRTKRGGETRYAKYLVAARERDRKFEERMDEFEKFVKFYGEITSSLVDLEDSFSCSLEISGKGLKDLVYNYPFVFEVSEKENIKVDDGSDVPEETLEVELILPDDGSPEIAIIDSGIMEEHRYLQGAIVRANSKSYVDGETSTADHVKGGGHGTRVAGAVIYPNGVPMTGSYQLPCFIRNLRVLNKDNKLDHPFPAELMEDIVTENQNCRVFNLSINSDTPSSTKHMSAWASTIDSLMIQNDILFIISAGNITDKDVAQFLTSGETYPNFLFEPFCRIANPGQSSFALTVGSINHSTYNDFDWFSLGGEDDISAFSRNGCGIWGMIKPDVVEYGGGFVASKYGGGALVTANTSTCPELIRSTLHGGNAIGKDNVGTSFSTPKVSFIVSQLLKLYPNEDANLFRAMVIQGARLPKNGFENPDNAIIRQMGYGIPSLQRVTENTAQRITFYNTEKIAVDEGHLYSLKIPDFLRSPAEEHDILIEVTLAYTANVRRTRQKTKSYLSTWLDWTTSKIGEPFVDFRDYVLKEINNGETSYDKDARNALPSWNWKIKNNIRGEVEGISRSNSTAQKDWIIIKSHELPEDFCFAVRAHKGWDEDHKEVPYALVVSFEVLNSELEIYEAIRLENTVEIEV